MAKYLVEVDEELKEPLTINWMNPLTINWMNYGGSPTGASNMPCFVCFEKKAIICFGDTVPFRPCWECQRKGYDVIQRGSVGRFIHRFFK